VSDLCHASFRKSAPKYARFYASGVLLDPPSRCGDGSQGAAGAGMVAMNDIPQWTEGVCDDGAAILRDGVMVPVEDVVDALNDLQAALLKCDEYLGLLIDFAEHAATQAYNEDRTLSWIAVVTDRARAARHVVAMVLTP